MGNTEQGMKWLVDCCDVTIPLAPQSSVPLTGDRTSAPEITIEECGEALIDVAEHLSTYWVYSWLGFSSLPNRLLLREGVIERLVLAKESLPDDFDLIVIDGWRSRVFQKELFRYYEVEYGADVQGFVSEAGAKAVPPHATGGAVDLTLAWRGAPLGLGTDFDAFTPAAAGNASEESDSGPRIVRELRRLLAGTLLRVGLAPYPLEWWHWSYGDQLWAATNRAPVAVYGEVSGLPL
jgi:zinc D-Ala-D-Ala dipeptidase